MLFALLFLGTSCQPEQKPEEYKIGTEIKLEIDNCYRLDSSKTIALCKKLELMHPNSDYARAVAYIGYSMTYEYWGVNNKALYYTSAAYKIADYKNFYEVKGKAILQFAKLYTENNIILRYLQQFETLSETYKVKDPKLLCEFNYLFGYYYREFEQTYLSKKHFRTAMKIALENRHYTELVKCLVGYSETYPDNDNENYKLLNLAENISRFFCPLEGGDVYYNKGVLYGNNKQFAKAKIYALKAQKAYSSHPHPYHPSIVEQLLGDIYLSQGNYQEAKKNYDIFLAKAQFPTTKIWASQKLFKYYLAVEDYKQAIYYKLKISDLTDEIHSKKKIIELTNMRAQFEKELDKQKFLNERKQYYLIILFSFIIIAVLGAFLILYRRSKDLEIKLAQGEAAKKDIEFEFKQRELATHTLYLDQNLNLLNNIKKHINEISTNQAPVQNQFNSLIKLIDNHINNNHNWGDYKMHFEAVSPLFFETLKNRTPSLTDLDLKHCVYIKMQMTPKQVAQLLGITPKSVTLSRVRLKKKLALDVDESLSEFIQKI